MGSVASVTSSIVESADHSLSNRTGSRTQLEAAKSFLSNLLPHVRNTGDSQVASLACMVM